MKTKNTFITMLLLVVTMSFAQKTAETTSQPYHQFSLDASYLISSNSENAKESKPLFAGNGINIGLNYRWGDCWGIASRVGFASGSVNQSGLQALADGWIPVPPKYRSEQTKSNWSQLSVMTGPSVKLGKNHAFEFNALAGIGFNPSLNTIRIDAYDQDVYLNTVYVAKDKSVVGLWQVNAKYNILKPTKNSFLGVNVGYGSNGLNIGISYDYVGHVTLLR